MGMYRVLVVDDEPYIVRILRDGLRAVGIEVLEAYDGEQAVSLARAQHPDLMLLDINMPKMNGYEVCRLLKSEPETRNIIIFMLTARGQESDEEESYTAGAERYFTKPLSVRKLVEEVKSTLEKRQSE